MKKVDLRACALTLLLLAGLAIPARAAENVSAVRVYEEQFTDVAPDAWYHDAVQTLYELGLTNGKDAPDRFAPEDSMALSEVLTLAARLRSLFETGGSETGPNAYSGGPWYLPYVAYLQSEMVIGPEFAGSFERPATRAEMAHVLANTLPQELFTPQNRDLVTAARASGRFMRDVNAATPYEADIVLLYDWGILGGADETGAFLPDQPISRCEVAAMAARLARAELRLTLDWEVPPAYAWQGSTMADLVASDGTFYRDPAPDDMEKIAADVRYMLSRGERKVVLQYEPGVLTGDAADELAKTFLYEVRQYVEQTYNYVYCTYIQKTGLMYLNFSSSLYGVDELERYRQETLDYALAVRSQLWENGTLTEDMPEYDKAKAYFTWICENCRYDFAAVGDDNSMSHAGWRLFTEGLAVCDGYTAAYNLLLKLEGIGCGTWSTSGHIWTVAELDGTTYHIDTTWGDQTGQIAYRFFGMTEAEASARFS
ncbi:MAG: S-layer homology domain-containing protein [Oscillospiraceae bacterium]|nr:S-layer homology domain-containing protein [Oscillospiraceae bacterium]